MGRKDERLSNLNITSQQIFQEIDKLRINKSLGVDEIFPRVLKECMNIISVTLTYIFNKSIASVVVLSLWRQTNVNPIFKKDDKSLMSKYQLINLTTVIVLGFIISKKV